MKEDKLVLLHPKLVERRFLQLMKAQGFPARYSPVVSALWNYSNDFFTEDQLINEDSSFTTTRTSQRQIALFTGGITQLKVKLAAMHELGYLDFNPDEKNPLGTVYTIHAKARHLAPLRIKEARRVKQFIKEVEAKFNDPDYLKDTEEQEAVEFDSGLMVDPWAGDETVRSAGRPAESKVGTQPVFTPDSAGFENRLSRFSLLTQPDAITTGFGPSGFKSSGTELASASSEHHNPPSEVSQKPPDKQSSASRTFQGAPPLDPAMGCAPVPATPAPQAPDIPDAALTPVSHHWHFEPRVGDDCMEDLVCAYCGVAQFTPEAGKTCPGTKPKIAVNSNLVHERN